MTTVRNSTLLATLLFCALLLTGCGSHYSSADLAGTYTLSRDGNVDTLVLEAGGKYEHRYDGKAGGKTSQQDTWRLEQLQAGLTVVLNRFLQSAGSLSGPVTYLLLVEKSSNGIVLTTNIDTKEGYRRQQ